MATRPTSRGSPARPSDHIPRQTLQSAWVTPTHCVASITQVKHAGSTVGSLQLSAPEPEPEPPPAQSDGHVVAVSPASHVLLPQIGFTVPEPEPEPEPLPCMPLPQSAA